MEKHSSSKESEHDKQKKPNSESSSIDQHLSMDEIREKFSTLYTELLNQRMSIEIDEVQSGSVSPSSVKEESSDKDPFSDYTPNIFDFLARAKTDEEGYEIIDFLSSQDQISTETASKLKNVLKKSGIRSFGPIRRPGYYFRQAEEINRRKTIEKRYHRKD
ncbi:MAG: DUF2095 family protein [Candidatus Hodarchaeales archaeon]|jgi:hypothetical protein